MMFVISFRISFFEEWDFYRELRPMIALIDRERSSRRVIDVGGSWVFEPCLNFYREELHITWMKPVVRRSPDAESDFYVLWGGDREVVAKKNLRVLLADPVSHAVLASGRTRPPGAADFHR
jgi:hypothetical protein